MQISTRPLSQLVRMPRFGTMVKKNNKAVLSWNELSVEQSQFDQALLEEVIDHHQHLSQMHEDDQEEEKMVVQSGNGTRLNIEKDEVKMKKEPSQFATNEVVKTEISVVKLKGIMVGTQNSEILTRLLRRSVKQSQFDQAQLEEVIDHYQHLTQMNEDDQ